MKTNFRISILGALACAFVAASGLRAQPVIEYLFNADGETAVNTGTLGAPGNGVLNNASISVENHPTAAGSSLALSGANSYVRTQNNFRYGNRATVEAWIKPTATDGQRVIWDDYGNPGVLLAIVNGSLQFNISTPQHPGLGIGIVLGTITSNVWQHVAGVYDGERLRVYVNGLERGVSEPTSGAIIENGASPALGAENVATGVLNFAGLIDDFRIYQEALPWDRLAAGVFVRLQIAANLTEATLQWRKNGFNYRLESTTNLQLGGWQPVLTTPVLIGGGGSYSVTESLSAEPKFFRLKLL